MITSNNNQPSNNNQLIPPANQRYQNKPVISYWKSSDPTKKMDVLKHKLTDINIIETRNFTEEFIKFCLVNRNKIYLHVVISGMGKTIFEPNIPDVRFMFNGLKYLIDNGFPQKQILVVVKPILPNDNGLKALKLLLRLFTEFKPLRLRNIRFNVLTYTQLKSKDGRLLNKYVPGNSNIAERQSTKCIMQYLNKTNDFWKDYYKLIDDYNAIISVDKGEEAIIGVRELVAFGITNDWLNTQTGKHEKIIAYEKGNKYKPIVNIISPKFATRCSNRCLLCPWKY